MHGERQGQAGSRHSRFAALAAAAIALGGCGTSSILSSSQLDLFSSSSKATTGKPSAEGAAPDPSDIECPGVDVRTGAATLMIGSKPGNEEPSALDLRYQGTILRTARECNVNAGVMNIKVGIEGRLITGPAGGPGTVDVPIRIAVVQEGPNPKPIVSKFVRVPVTIAGAVDRATFTHIEPDVSFPMPVPASLIDAYVVYVGFDPLGAPAARKPAPRRSPRR